MTTDLVSLKHLRLRPARRWRNWWRDLEDVGDPDPYPDCDAWPSKEIAEQKALEDLADDFRANGRMVSEYLGAEPD